MAVAYRPRRTVDFEKLMTLMLAYDGLTVVPAVDVTAYENLPLLAFRGLNGAAISNVDPAGPIATGWDLTLTLWTSGFDGDLCDTIYQNVHDMEGHYLPGVGSVVRVEDQAIFDRVAGVVLPDKQVVQYDASFGVIVEPV